MMHARAYPHGDLLSIGFVLMLASGAVMYGTARALWLWCAG